MIPPSVDAGVPIFDEHWGDNLHFSPVLPFFSAGGMNLDYNFVPVSKLSEDKKKVFTKNGTLFFSNSNEDQKKRNTFFSPIQVETCAQMHTRVKLLGGGMQT